MKFCWCVILILSVAIYSFQDDSGKYGKFVIKLTSFTPCQGPKRENCSIFSGHVQNETSLNISVDIKKSMAPTKGKIVALSNGNPMVRLHMNKPCDHLFLRPLFKVLLNVSDKCIIRKGTYKYVIDIEDIAREYFGGTFVFGNFSFFSSFYNSECNLSCSVLNATLSPRKNV